MPLFIWLAFVGIAMAIGTLGVIVWSVDTFDETVAHTMGLVTFSLFHLFFSLETSDEERTIFSSELLDNPMLLKTSALSLLTIFLATTFGPLQRVLDTVELTIDQWALWPSSRRRSSSSPRPASSCVGGTSPPPLPSPRPAQAAPAS